MTNIRSTYTTVPSNTVIIKHGVSDTYIFVEMQIEKQLLELAYSFFIAYRVIEFAAPLLFLRFHP